MNFTPDIPTTTTKTHSCSSGKATENTRGSSNKTTKISPGSPDKYPKSLLAQQIKQQISLGSSDNATKNTPGSSDKQQTLLLDHKQQQQPWLSGKLPKTLLKFQVSFIVQNGIRVCEHLTII